MRENCVAQNHSSSVFQEINPALNLSLMKSDLFLLNLPQGKDGATARISLRLTQLILNYFVLKNI